MAKYCPFCVSRIDQGDTCPFCNYAYTYQAKPYHLKPGTLLNNKYLVGTVLGEGGFGITYLGRDLILDMKVAIKEYYPSSIATRVTQSSNMLTPLDSAVGAAFKSGKDQFIYEAQTIAKMDKESAVVTVREFFEQNNSAYIVMEFIEGQDLRTLMNEKQAPMAPRELLLLLEPVFSALDELHEIGLIHRDISPDNIMIENGRARLIDFGCARDTLGRVNTETALKHSFSPVEQYNNSNMGPWSDVYAMAATIYYCVTGKLAPKATDRVLHDEIKSPNSLGAKLSAKQEKALMKALAVDPTERYQSMEEFGKELFAGIHTNWYKYVAIAAVAVAAVTTACVLLFGGDTRVETMERARTVSSSEIVAVQNLTREETDMLDQLTEVLENASFAWDNSYIRVNLKNDTDYEFEQVRLDYRVYDSKGTVIENAWDTVKDWEQEGGFSSRIYCYDQELGDIQVRGTITAGDRQFQTEYVKLSSDGIQQEAGFTVELKNKLPAIFQCEGYQRSQTYTITSFEMKPSGDAFYVYFGGSYDRGPDNTTGYIAYRLTDVSGKVFDTGSISLGQLRAGDEFANVSEFFYNIPSGHYILELSDYS